MVYPPPQSRWRTFSSPPKFLVPLCGQFPQHLLGFGNLWFVFQPVVLPFPERHRRKRLIFYYWICDKENCVCVHIWAHTPMSVCHRTLIRLRKLPLIPCWATTRAFYRKEKYSMLSNAFCLYWDDHIVFLLLMNCYVVNYIQKVSEAGLHGKNPTWSSFIILFSIWLVSMLLLCLNCLHLHSLVKRFCDFFLLWQLCLILASGVYWPHRMS